MKILDKNNLIIAMFCVTLTLCFSVTGAFAQAKKNEKATAKKQKTEQKTAKQPVTAIIAPNAARYIIHPNGLDLHEKPQKESKILVKMPCATQIELLEGDYDSKAMLETARKTMTNHDGQNGFWLKVKYNKQVGYCINVFLHDKKPDSLQTDIVLLQTDHKTYSNSSDYNWYGIYKKDKMRLATKKTNAPIFYTDINARNVAQTLTKAKDSTSTDSLCVVLALRKKNNQTIRGGMLSESVCIGGLQDKNSVLKTDIDARETVAIGLTDWRLKLEKTFMRIERKTEQDKPTAELTDWKLLLVRKDFKQKQLLLERNTSTKYDKNFEIKVVCQGDFDQDGNLDFLLSIGTEQGNFSQYLFLSSIAEKGNLVRLSANETSAFAQPK